MYEMSKCCLREAFGSYEFIHSRDPSNQHEPNLVVLSRTPNQVPLKENNFIIKNIPFIVV